MNLVSVCLVLVVHVLRHHFNNLFQNLYGLDAGALFECYNQDRSVYIVILRVRVHSSQQITEILSALFGE